MAGSDPRRLGLLAALALVALTTAAGPQPGPAPSPDLTWARGVEGQRKADLGNGTYLNPIMSGDHPDPSILRDGDDYYMTFSSFDAYPGLVIWHSKDLVNWEPLGPTLFTNVGSVWAPDLVKHGGRYYIYFPGVGPYRSNYVIWADSIRGPWSEPLDLKIGQIDPGHAVGPDGRRYLFLSAGQMVALADDGLSVVGTPKKVYDGWKYPEDWIVEGFAQEGPKILRHGGYYHMVLAEGGTAGPPTGHMIVSARAKSIEGPWENSPYNPVVRTRSASERWWSKGHGTLVEAPDGRWFIVYHAYENGFYTLGRQTLLEPIEWTADGWFKTAGFDPARPIPKPAGAPVPHGMAFSDDFSTDRMGIQWSFYKGSKADRARYRFENGALVLKARGTSPSDASPLSFVTGDHAYEIEVDVDADPGATAGLLLFYSSRLYAGLGFSAKNFFMHSYGLDRPQGKPRGHRPAAAHPHPQRSTHRDDGVQRGWASLAPLRPRHGAVGLPPQRRLRISQPAARPLCGGNRRGAIPELPLPRAAVEPGPTRLHHPAQTRARPCCGSRVCPPRAGRQRPRVR